MPYQGRQPGVGVRNRFIFIATSGQTSFSGADSNGLTLKYPDATYTDVFLNGVLLIPVTDYAATNNTSVVLSSGAGTSDVVEIVAYDISSIANTVPVSGGTFTGPVTVGGTLDVTGAFTSLGIDDNATSTAMTLDASGNLLVGKTASDFNTQGFEINSGGQLRNSRASGAVAFLNRKTDNGSIVDFGKDGSVVGSIGTISSEIFLGSTGGTDAFVRMGYDTVAPATSSGLNRDAAIKLGASNNRFKDLYLSGGVYLGGTGSANKLDDYEEGTWTPVIDGTSGNPTVTYTGNTGGIYTKVGDTVFVSFEVRWSAITGGGGAARISGLPFARLTASTPDGDRGSLDFYNVTVPSGGVSGVAGVGSSTSTVGLTFTRSGTSSTDLPVANLINTNPGFLRASLTYKV